MSERFSFSYQPGTLMYGAGIVDELGAELDRLGCSRALIVCGSTVGATTPVIDPVTAGAGDRLVGVFDKTSAEKYLATVLEGARRVDSTDADVLVGLGAGSSLDTTKLVSVLAAHDDPAAAARRMVADGTVHLPDGDPLPTVMIPTTLAGADLSVVAGTRLALDSDPVNDEVESVGVADERLMPAAGFYDPALFEHTPTPVLTGSAMNGFDKGLEMVYSRDHTAITDATATHGLGLLGRGLPTLGTESPAFEDIVRGLLLVQYGLSTAETYRASLIHAFGHGFSRRYDATQGVIHAILAPHVLRYLFEEVDGRRNLLAGALGIETESLSDAATAEAVIAEVETVRDAMDLPVRLRTVDGLDQSHFPAIVETIMNDSFMTNVPAGLDPTEAVVTDVLEAAW